MKCSPVVPVVETDSKYSAEDQLLPEDWEDVDRKPLPTEDTSHEAVPNRLLSKERRELHRHRLEGHSTYHPSCLSCRNSKGVHRHNRRIGKASEKGIEVQADYAYLKGSKGETLQVLVLTECSTGALGFIAMQDRERAVFETSRWFASLGLNGPSSSIVLVRADAEDALIVFLNRVFSSPDGPRAKPEKCAPQSHESVGGAERGVRCLKESLSCVRHDMQTDGVDLVISQETLPYVIRYLAVTHNNHKRVFGGQKTPMQLVIGQERQALQTSAFCSVVHAECPDSIESPAETRFVLAAYLGPEYGSRASLVCAPVGNPPAHKIFRARSVKVLDKIVFEAKLCPTFLVSFSDPQRIESPKPDESDIKPGRPLPQAMPSTGPPARWLKENGRTPGCYACQSEKFHGRVHSRRCKERYLAWYESQTQKSVEGQDGFPSSSHEIDFSKEPQYHPTGNRRYDEKKPPVPVSVVDESNPREKEDWVEEHDAPMDSDCDYEPSEAPMEEDQPMEVDELMVPPHPLSVLTSPPPVKDQPVLMPFYLPKIGEPTQFEPFEFGGSVVYLARPSSSFSEDGVPLDLEKSLSARMTELVSMNNVKFGRVVSRKEAMEYCAKWGIKPIGCRWVIGPKDLEGIPGVRCRMVVQEIAVGPSAAALGVSASTPSAESLRVLLATASTQRMHLSSLDVSAAFMHAPLPKGVKVCVRLPGDISADNNSHQPSFAILDKALNGLRAAALAWLQHARKPLKDLGLATCLSEPTIMAGRLEHKGRKYETAVLVYVDDILICSTCAEAHLIIQKALLKVVNKVKITGEVPFDKGGTLTFLGREITRAPKGEEIFLRIPTDYLKELLVDLAPSCIPPNILSDLEKSEDSPELSSEEASEFRSRLGRLAWWFQSRPDLLRYSSLLSQGQARPRQCHNHALTRVLRFVKSQLHLYQSFPSGRLMEYSLVVDNKVDPEGLCVFSDASWGSLESEQRRSCSGYVLSWRNCVLKRVSRLQVVVALSSCEAETVALLHSAQEALGLSKLVQFIKTFGGCQQQKSLLDFDLDTLDYQGAPIACMITDSSSAREVLLGEGLSRKVRRMSIAVYFLQAYIKQGIIRLLWGPGKEQLGDGLTKILSREGVERIRNVLGFVEQTKPEDWQLEKLKPGKKKMPQKALLQQSMVRHGWLECLREFQVLLRNGASWILFLEVCASKKSGFAPCHLSIYNKKNFYILQIDKDDDIVKCGFDLQKEIYLLRQQSPFAFVVWFSPPCAGGFPAQHLTGTKEEVDLRISDHFLGFAEILKWARPLLEMADVECLEMSRSCSFWKAKVVKDIIKTRALSCTLYYPRCMYDDVGEEAKAQHVFRVQANASLGPTRICSCSRHLSFSNQNLQALGSYPKSLVKEICRRVADHFEHR